MIFAAYMDDGYKFMLLLHILLMFVGFAPALLTPAFVRLTANGDPAAADNLEASILRFTLPAIGLGGLLGFGLAGMSGIPGTDELMWSVSDPWIMVSVLLWLVLLAVTFFVTRPALRSFRDGDRNARGQIMMGMGVSHIVLVVVLFLMVFKPGA